MNLFISKLEYGDLLENDIILTRHTLPDLFCTAEDRYVFQTQGNSQEIDTTLR